MASNSRIAASANVAAKLNPDKTATYNATIKKMLFEKQHMFMQTLLVGMTYDELDQCEIATETSSTVCTEEEDDYDSDLDDDASESDEDDTDDEDDSDDDDDDDDSSFGDDEFAEFEELANEHLGRYARRLSSEPLQETAPQGDWSKDIEAPSESAPKASATVRFNPTVVFVEQEEEESYNEESSLDILDDRCPALNLLAVVNGSDDRYIPSTSVECYFMEHSPEQIAAYDSRLIRAIRCNDVQEIRRMHREEGHILQASNQFGETVIHIAARRGSLDIIKYMVEEAGVTIRVRDDYGRTPMHDCCWTTEPNVELMAYLVNLEPDMLFMTDVKGFTPLEYARCEHRPTWNRFLADIRDVVTSQCRIGRILCSI